MNDIILIMSGKSKYDLEKISMNQINEEMQEHAYSFRYYKRLIVIKLVKEGFTIKDAADFIRVSYPTAHRWVKTAQQEGLIALKPSFAGGRPSKLTYEQMKELDKIIEESSNLTMTDVKHIVKEKFNVDYSLKQITIIVRKLGYNYSKAYPIFTKSPEDAEEQLKKT